MYNICGDGYRRRVSTTSVLPLVIEYRYSYKRRPPADRHIACMSRYSLYPPPQPHAQLSLKQEAIRQTTYSVYTCTHCMIPAED